MVTTNSLEIWLQMFTAMLNTGSQKGFLSQGNESVLQQENQELEVKATLRTALCHVQHWKWVAVQREENHSPHRLGRTVPEVSNHRFYIAPRASCKHQEKKNCPEDVSFCLFFHTKFLFGFFPPVTAASALPTFSCSWTFHLPFPQRLLE